MLIVGIVATVGVVFALNHLSEGPPRADGCSAAGTDREWDLSVAQADNAALVALTAVRRGLPARAATIGIATAMQESKLINIAYGDRDSLGLFQQRPSQGWGTAAQVQDPVYATNAFYDELATVEGYETMEITDAAQAVQRSAFPEAYARHELRARAWASGLTGYTPAAITCQLGAPDTAATDGTATLRTRIERDLGTLPQTATASGVTVDARGLVADDPARAAWAVGQWAVATAHATGADSVQVTDHRWSRETGEWQQVSEEAPVTGHVRIATAGD